MKISQDNEILLKFMVVNICSGVAIGMINIITPLYALSLNASTTEIGLIKGVSGFGDLLVVLPAGILADYLGTRKLYVASCIVGGVTIVAFSFAGSVTGLMLMMVAYGMARTIRTTSLSAAFFKYMGRIGVRRGGWYKGSMMVGSTFIGPAIGGFLAALISFASFFLLTAAFLIAPLAMVAANLFRRKRHPGKAGRGGASIKGSLGYYRELLRNKELVAAAVADGVNTAFFITFTTFVTVLVVRDIGLSALIAAMLITVRGGTHMLVVFFCGEMVQNDSRKLYLASMAGTIIGLILLGTARDVPMLAFASLVTGVCSGMISLITFTRVGSIRGEKGKIAGLFTFGTSIGSIAGPVLGGIIADIFGIPAIFLFFAAFYAALTLYAMLDGNRITAVSATTL